jgi:hypothetical protein
MKCVRCGKAVIDGHAFCGWCGERLAGNSIQSRTEGTSPQPSPQPTEPMLTSGDLKVAKPASSQQPRATETAAVIGLACLAIIGISIVFPNKSTPTPATPVAPQPSAGMVSALPVPRYEMPLVPYYEPPPPVYVPMKVPEMPRFTPPQFTPPPMPQYSQWQPIPMQPTLQPLPQPVIQYSMPVMQMRRIEPVPATPTKQALTDVIQQLEQPKPSGQVK